MTEKQYLTKQEVADIFRITPMTVYRWTQKNILKPHKIKGTKKTLYNYEDVNKLLKDSKVKK